MIHAAFTELALQPRWVVWREEQRNGKSTKVPYQTNGAKASSTDPKTWRRLAHVLPAVGDFDGAGIVLGDLGDGRCLFGVDLDACLFDDGLAPWAAGIVERFRTYAEVSPSGCGIKIFGLTADPPRLTRNKIVPPDGRPNGKMPEIAVYTEKRYFTVTGRQYGDWSEIEDCTEALYWLANELARHGDAARCDHPDLPPRVAAALQVDAAFKHLWATGKHDGPDTSRSGSDCALANALHRLGCDFGEFSTALQAWHHGQDRPLPERRLQRLWDLVSGVSPYGEADVPPSEPIDAGASSIPNLCEALWIARPVLTAIREYAHSRTCSADAALGYLLARTAAFMPHLVRIDSGVLCPTPPNLFTLLIGTAGAGKSSTHQVFRDVIVPDGINPADDCPIGSGEGLAEAYMGDVEVPGGKKPKIERRQVRHNALFIADEGAVIKKLASRDGATLGESLRRAFTGATLGQSNASKETTRRVEIYNLGLVANFTPGAAGAILDDAEAGTPQRFLWFAATDPAIPEHAPRVGPPCINIIPPEPVLWVCPKLREAIRKHRVAAARGEIAVPELDGHKQLILLRIAAILAVWDGRAEVSEDDWAIASEIWKTSCGVRDWIIAERRRLEDEAEAEKTRRAAIRSVVVSHAVKNGNARIAMLARRVALKVHEHGRMTNRDITRKTLRSEDRGLVPAIVEAAEALGWIVPDGDHAWRAGPSRPV